MSDAAIKVLSVDDHPLLREGIAAMIKGEPDMTLVASVSNGKEGIEAFRNLRPDVTLMDLRLPDMSGIEVMIAILAEFPQARIVVLTTFQGDAQVQRALQAGAHGYLLKSMAPAQMLATIRLVHTGKKSVPAEVAAGLAEHLGDEVLTEREIEVLRYVAEGNRNRDVGYQLHISEDTVKVHLKHILGKLGANDRTQAVAIAVRRGIIHL